MSAFDAVELLDVKLKILADAPHVLWGNETASRVLSEVRDALTAGPEWSEVQESNLRAQLVRLGAEREHFRTRLDDLQMRRDDLGAANVRLRRERDALRAQMEAQVEAELAMASLYGETIRGLEDALERARSVAVRLEQENAALTTGAGRRVL